MKTAIVTGASKGVGYETVKVLSESGYKVIAVSRNLNELSNLVSNNVETYKLDITNELNSFDQIPELLQEILVKSCAVLNASSGLILIEDDNSDVLHIGADFNLDISKLEITYIFVKDGDIYKFRRRGHSWQMQIAAMLKARLRSAPFSMNRQIR